MGSAAGVIDVPVDVAIAAHAVATDPHGDRAFASSAVSTHAGASDPHGDRAFATSSITTHAGLTSSVHGISSFMATVNDDTTAAAARTTLGAVGGSVGSTANALVRTSGTAGETIQGNASGATLSDAGALSLPGTGGSAGSMLTMSPQNGAVTLGQTWGVFIMTANGMTLQTGSSDRILVKNNGNNPGFVFANAAGTIEAGLMRNAAGVLEINSGTVGTYRDLLLRNLTASGPVIVGAYTFATVPSASANTGAEIRITDRSGKFAYSDGTNWRFFGDDAVIS